MGANTNGAKISIRQSEYDWLRQRSRILAWIDRDWREQGRQVNGQSLSEAVRAILEAQDGLDGILAEAFTLPPDPQSLTTEEAARLLASAPRIDRE
jgi:hypothetical protein